MKLIRKMKSDTALTIESGRISYPQPSFHESFSFVIIFGQLFGIMPINGVRSKNVSDVKFRWKSVKFFYSIYNLLGSCVMAIFCITKFAIDGLKLDKTGTMAFYILNFFGAFQFIQIAKHWSTILREFSFVEISMRSYGPVSKLKAQFKLLTIIIMVLALIEHLLFIINALVASNFCRNFHEYPTQIYFGITFPSVFTVISYSPWKAAFVEIANVISTVTWNFTDLFIILISCSLATRFAQIVKRLEQNKLMHEKFWREIREDYNKLTQLVRIVDEHLAPLVMISFINNTFFICVQLYNSLKERVGVVETIYYFYSFGFLLGRTAAVTLYGAWINDESRKPLYILHSVPSEYYCEEISRLVEQINSSPVGMTGSKFFIITRSFLLKMASTIVTFELMFLQFGPLIKADTLTGFESSYECIK